MVAPVLSVDLPSASMATAAPSMGIAVRATETRHLLSGASRGIYCCRGGFFAVAFALPISGSIRTCSGKFAQGLSKTFRSSGATRFRCRGSTAINTPAAMLWWSSGDLAATGAARMAGAARYGLARDW